MASLEMQKYWTFFCVISCGEELDWHTFTLSFEMQILFSCSSDKCFWLTVCFSS